MKKLILSLIFLSASLLATDISTYNSASYKTSDVVKTKLQSAGFEVVGEYNVMADSKYHVVAFTNATLKKEASAEGRGFAGVLKVLVNSKDKTLVFTNPEYFLHAFLQDDYKKNTAKSINKKLASAFGKLKAGKTKMDDDDLASYHYMFGMPYYEDPIELAEGSNLGAKLEKNAGKNLVFKVKLGKATLYGVAMHTANGEKSYVPTIEATATAAFLPYMVLVEDGKAKILHGKYYLAISNPDLSMGQFTKIMSTPGDIESYLGALVK